MAKHETWTTSELAQEAGVSTAYIRQLIIAGKLQATKRAKAWFIDDDEARRWLESRRKDEQRPG